MSSRLTFTKTEINLQETAEAVALSVLDETKALYTTTLNYAAKPFSPRLNYEAPPFQPKNVVTQQHKLHRNQNPGVFATKRVILLQHPNHKNPVVIGWKFAVNLQRRIVRNTDGSVQITIQN